MEQKTEQFIEALEASEKYEEGAVGNLVKAGAKAVGKWFNSKVQNATNAINNKANNINIQNDDINFAKTLNDNISNALKIAQKELNKINQNSKKDTSKSNPTPEQQKQVTEAQPEQQQESDGTAVKKESLKSNLFLNAYYEAQNTNTKAYYNKAIKTLQNIQAELRPFLTGQKAFDKESLQKISGLINDSSIQNVLGKNSQEALSIIQKMNSSINEKIKEAPEAQQPQQSQNDPNKDAKTEDSKQSENAPAENSQDPKQPTNPANPQASKPEEQPTSDNGGVEANAEAKDPQAETKEQSSGETPINTETLQAVNQVKNNTTGTFDALKNSVTALNNLVQNQGIKNSKINAVLQAFEDYEKEKQKLDNAVNAAKNAN